MQKKDRSIYINASPDGLGDGLSLLELMPSLRGCIKDDKKSKAKEELVVLLSCHRDIELSEADIDSNPDICINIRHNHSAMSFFFPATTSLLADIECRFSIVGQYDSILGDIIGDIQLNAGIVDQRGKTLFQSALHDAVSRLFLSQKSEKTGCDESSQEVPQWFNLEVWCNTCRASYLLTHDDREKIESHSEHFSSMQETKGFMPHHSGLALAMVIERQHTITSRGGYSVMDAQPEPTSGLHRNSILIVDDTDFNLLMLDSILKKDGFTNIRQAKNGLAALEQVMESPPDLIILDLMMPVMDGFEFCRRLRALPAHSDIPILVQSAVTDAEHRTLAFKVGATDLVSKPVNAAELIARTKVHLQNRSLLSKLAEYHQSTEQELEQASQLQLTLLPTKPQLQKIEENHKMEIASFFRPSKHIGGDFWSVESIDAEHLSISMVDISGHGISAALNTFRLRTLFESWSNPTSPSHVLDYLNKAVHRMFKRGQYATMFYGVVDTKKHRLTYSSAAYPPALLWSAEKGSIRLLEQKHFPLGMNRDAVFQEETIPFHPGEMLCLYSDALTETAILQEMDDELSLEQLQNIIRKLPAGSNSAQALDALLKAFKRYSRSDVALPDDLTIAVCRRRLAA